MSNPAADPKPQEDTSGDGRWMSMHECFLHEAKEKEPEVLLIGDLHIQFMAQSKVWQQMFEPLHSLNFGIYDDRTENILWRVNNGELDGITPKVIVIQAGHNNHDHSVDQVTQGVMAICKAVRDKQPSSHLIVMGLLPRGQKPNPVREKYSSINQKLCQELSALPCTSFFRTDDKDFVTKDKVIEQKVMADFLHLTSSTGYQRLCEPLLEEVQNLLGTFVKVESTSFDMGTGDGGQGGEGDGGNNQENS